ncbi:hypothetical protein ATJ93_4465 [Halopiger aswanensis]|uniref:Uncharacterized protein n=1 Tax=Halopiger aswanensis TaxID=148449 RepID=A0A419VY21_9EURY|nr:hypothetical protein ATJ93_4465 [Halopiger aswanensis]
MTMWDCVSLVLVRFVYENAVVSRNTMLERWVSSLQK